MKAVYPIKKGIKHGQPDITLFSTNSNRYYEKCIHNTYFVLFVPIPVNQFDKCPVLLTQPDQDRWTPLHLSEISMKGIKAHFTVILLNGGGHYPMGETALQQLLVYSVEFIKSLK